MTFFENFVQKNGLIEAATNSIGGYPIGFVIGIIVLPLSVNWIQKDPILANLVITSIYVGVSFVRTLILRNAFDGSLAKFLKKKSQTMLGDQKNANN
ncbi:MAG: hypothetical protein ACKOCL_03485 [Candidatus Nanopelagicaceae bacterium]|nr:hypothetical protein [Bacteroidota bacterium]MBM4102167.1 hypothetical protein [Phycisphaerae bacterium]